jgi:hypothetical protein
LYIIWFARQRSSPTFSTISNSVDQLGIDTVPMHEKPHPEESEGAACNNTVPVTIPTLTTMLHSARYQEKRAQKNIHEKQGKCHQNWERKPMWSATSMYMQSSLAAVQLPSILQNRHHHLYSVPACLGCPRTPLHACPQRMAGADAGATGLSGTALLPLLYGIDALPLGGCLGGFSSEL